MGEDDETKVTCPACDGAGATRTEDATTYQARVCELCQGRSMVTPSVAAAWRKASPTRSILG